MTTLLNVRCDTDRAVVPVRGAIEEEMMLQLVAALRRLCDEYFYTRIELEISSPGGQAAALDYCVEAMDSLRARGVRFTTRALLSVSSAAANLVSLGDEREAARGATFLYHQSRAMGTEIVTAQSARRIQAALGPLDERYLTRLVARARRSKARRPAQQDTDFTGNDWTVMAYLLVDAGLPQAGARGVKRARSMLLRALRKQVAACLRADDARPLKHLYRRLLEFDSQISAALALELRLVDRLTDACPPGVALPAREQALTIPEWAPLFGPDGRAPRSTLCRHTLALGETGSGKTRSGVLPVIGSIMAPDNTLVGCTLVIDPKHEIRQVVRRLAHPGIAVHDIDVTCARRPVLNLMDGDGASFGAAPAARGQYLEAARQLLLRSVSLSPLSAARALTDTHVADRDIYWAGEGARLGQTALGLTLLLLSQRRRIYGDREAPGLIMDAAPATRALLAEFGKEAGLLVEHRDVIALAQDARRRLEGLRQLWGDANKRRHEEEEREEAESRRREYPRRSDPDPGAVAEWRQGLFSQQDHLLLPSALADEMQAQAQAAARAAAEAAAQAPDAAALYEQWRAAADAVLESFAEALRATPLQRADKRFRVVLAAQLEAAGELDFPDLFNHTLPAIEHAALQPLADEALRPAPNVMALAHAVLQSFFRAAQRTESGGHGRSGAADMPALALVKLLRDKLPDGQAEALCELIEHSWNPMARTEHQGQYIGVYGHARTCFTDFADKTPAWTLYFGCEPYYQSVLAHGRADFLPLDFRGAVADTDPARRRLYLFQPRLDQNEAIVAKALKAAFFEAVLANRRRRLDGPSMPLVAYVADEFHRFITSDRHHGEQSFLDTCRSFGAFCVLACQSVASLEHALAGSGNNGALNHAAVSILLNNTGNKLFFRSTDRALHERVAQLCPGGGALGKLTEVRPLSTLRPGECYAALSDGRFERRRLLPFGGDQTGAPGAVTELNATGRRRARRKPAPTP